MAKNSLQVVCFCHNLGAVGKKISEKFPSHEAQNIHTFGRIASCPLLTEVGNG